MHANQSYHKLETPQYVEALLQCQDKKVCTNLAKTLNVSHDNVYRNFRTSISNAKHSSRALETIAHNELDENNTYLIHDDTHLIKLYAKQIEGIEVGFDGSTSRSCLGIKMMTSLLTDTKVNIPIDATPYVSKELAQNSHKTKSRLAIETTKHVVKLFKIKRMLGEDAFQKIRRGQEASITKSEAERFFRLDDYVTGRARVAKIERFRIIAANNSELANAINILSLLVKES